MNKFCEVCRKPFEYDEIVTPYRKYCSKQCYMYVLKKRVTPKKGWLYRFTKFCRDLISKASK